jgi:hypothetical protein
MLKIAPDYQVGRWTGDDPRTLRNFYAMVDSDDILLAIKGFADHHAEAEVVPQQNPQQSRGESDDQGETEESESLVISGTDCPCPMEVVRFLSHLFN